MNEGSRTQNAKRNMTAGVINRILNILLPFITRTVVLYLLGTTYQGLSSLFTSVLQVLNLTDMGFSTVVIYILYKPIAEEDYDSVCAIVAFLKRIYLYVGLVILGLGLAIMPFLDLFITGEVPGDINIYILYVMYLCNSCISYLCFAYKSALLNAMQRQDLVHKIGSWIAILLRILQVIILFITRNYYLFVAAMIVCTLINNILLQVTSKRYFPEIEPRGKISKEMEKTFFKQVKGIVFNRLSDTARNSLDNIILSSLLGLTMVAIYDNYYYIYSAVYGIALVITNALQAGIGNSIVKETEEKNYSDFKMFTFIFGWFSGWCTVCMFCLYQHFMGIWMNYDNDMMLSNFNMALFCIYFYAIAMCCIRNLYTNGRGLFWELRKLYVAEALANLILNIALGYFMGVTGIILATILTIFLFNFVARTNVLFREYFKISPARLYRDHVFYATVTLAACAVTYAVCSVIKAGGIAGLIIKLAICVVVPNIIFLICYCKTAQMQKSIVFFRSNIMKKS